MMISNYPARLRRSARLRPHAWVMLYWLAFLLVLEPGNVLRATQAGETLSLPHETVRILLAAMLGATVTSAVQGLVERFPLRGAGRSHHLLIHTASAAGLSLALVLASCLLAAWVFEGRWLPSWDAIWDQLAGNFTLLMFALGALTALFQIRPKPMASPGPVDPPAPNAAAAAPSAPATLTHLDIKRRGERVALPLTEVDWIEAQGNYVALHVGAEQHLIRGTVSNFATRVDGRQFIRIHRSMIVAVDRVQRVEKLDNGDALLHLIHGAPLRASRSYAATVKQLAAQPGDTPPAADAGRI
jgi:hypothetical protein